LQRVPAALMRHSKERLIGQREIGPLSYY